MAISVYPNSIPVFPTHQNLIEDVDANHINVIQRELTAVARMLGINPQIYNDLEVASVDTPVIPNDYGGMDVDETYTTALQYYNPTIKPVNHGTVSQRLDDIERGAQTHVFDLHASNISISRSSNTDFSTRPKAIRMPKPMAAHDPFGMYNGHGVTLRKSGFWSITGVVVFNLQAASGHATDNDGMFQSTIDDNGYFAEGMDRYIHSQGTNSNFSTIVLRSTHVGFMKRGDWVTLRASHSSAITQKIQDAFFAGHLIREDIS